MLLVCDIGNSNIVFGIYEGDQLRAQWRITSRLNATVDEYLVTMGTLLERELAPVGTLLSSVHGRSAGSSLPGFQGGILSSVVPPLTGKVSEVLQALCGHKPLEVGPGIKTGLDIQYEDPREVGADRIVNAVGVLARHAPPLIVVDFGTATTYELLLPPNIYAGGVITPGLYIALDALVSRTAKLPKVELRAAGHVLGRNTAESIRSGLVNGTAAQCDGIIDRICEEYDLAIPCGGDNLSPQGSTPGMRQQGAAATGPANGAADGTHHVPTVVATGGYAQLIQAASRRIQFVEPDLTLFGLRELWLRNAP